MDMKGSELIPVSQETAWQALNDPVILKDCIPGCEVIDRLSENEYEVTMTAKVGPVSARFKGRMTVTDADPPRSYTLVFEGQGGVAGFAKGQASVELVPQDEGTQLAYTARANIGGKLAQVGARLIDGVAKRLAAQFFTKFNQRVSQGR